MSSTQPARYPVNAPGYNASTIKLVAFATDGDSYQARPTDQLIMLDLATYTVDDGPDIFLTTPVEDFPVQIRNTTGSGALRNWTVSSSVPGVLVEDPGNPNTFLPIVTIAAAEGGGSWTYDRARNRWVLDAVGAGGGGGGGGAGSLNYSHFFALMPGDNSATVGAGAAVMFPQNGPTSGAAVRTGPSTFQIVTAGTYAVDWQVSISEPGQLMLRVNAGLLPDTVAGRAGPTTQIENHCLVVFAAGDIVEVINPPGNPAALTITPIAGGTHSVSATLTFTRVDVAGGGQGPAGPPGPPAVATESSSTADNVPVALGAAPAVLVAAPALTTTAGQKLFVWFASVLTMNGTTTSTSVTVSIRIDGVQVDTFTVDVVSGVALLGNVNANWAGQYAVAPGAHVVDVRATDNSGALSQCLQSRLTIQSANA